MISKETAAPQTAAGGSTWTPLRHSLYRWIWIASVVSNVGTWMQNVGAAWLMTSLASSSPLYVALVQTATNLPVFLLGVPAGAVADIFDRRRLLIWSQALMLAAAALLAVLTIPGLAGPWTLLWLTFALGVGATMNGPAWQAIVPELVPRAELPAAIALNSVGFNLARAVGPALGGIVVAAVGAGWAFMMNAVSFVAVILVLYFWRRPPEEKPAAERVGPAMLAGFRYVRFEPVMHSVLLRSGAFVLSASAIWAMLPLMARDELHSESTGYGILLACLGLGSIIGALILSRIRRHFKVETLVTAGVVLFGLVTMALSFLASFFGIAIVLLLGGIAWMTVNSNLNTAAQTALPSWVRARALALYLLVFQGAMAVGSVIWGAVASRYGLRSTMLAAGIALVAAAVVTWRMQLDSGSIDVRPSQHWPEPHIEVAPHPERGPVLVTVEYVIDPKNAAEFDRAMRQVERIRRRDGAVRWGLFEDMGRPGRFIETFVVASWAEHLRQHERITVGDREVEQRAWAFHSGPERPLVRHWLASGEGRG